MQLLDEISVSPEHAIQGDRYHSAKGARQITLIQYEHLATIASLLGIDAVAPETLRRNIAVSGINLLALKGHAFKLGEVTLQFTGLCHPCSRMEELFGPGGYNAVRGHGGITARIIVGGRIALQDRVHMVPAPQART